MYMIQLFHCVRNSSSHDHSLALILPNVAMQDASTDGCKFLIGGQFVTFLFHAGEDEGLAEVSRVDFAKVPDTITTHVRRARDTRHVNPSWIREMNDRGNPLGTRGGEEEFLQTRMRQSCHNGLGILLETHGHILIGLIEDEQPTER
jgi:hypothetical protein